MEKTKRNTIIQKADKSTETIRSLRELNLADDFMFDVTTNNLECCRIILELSLGMRIKSIRWHGNQKVVRNLPGKRGIRLDFYVESEDGTLYDVEMQKRNRGNIPKRTRFYQSLIDAPLLKSGEESFDRLNPSYIVVICDFDLYSQKRYRYTFTNQCREVQGLELGDESTKVILNTKGENDDEVERPLVEFPHYISNSTDRQITETSDERLRRLHEIIESIRTNSEMEVVYMKAETREREIKEEGRQEGRIESIFELLEELGGIPEEIRERIRLEQDIQILSKWHKIAARVESIKEFMDKM